MKIQRLCCVSWWYSKLAIVTCSISVVKWNTSSILFPHFIPISCLCNTCIKPILYASSWTYFVPCTFRNWLRFERTRSRTCSKPLIFVKNPWGLPSRPFLKVWDSTPTFKVNLTPAPVHALQFEFLKHPKLAVLKTPYSMSFHIWKTKSYKQIWQVLKFKYPPNAGSNQHVWINISHKVEAELRLPMK